MTDENGRPQTGFVDLDGFRVPGHRYLDAHRAIEEYGEPDHQVEETHHGVDVDAVNQAVRWVIEPAMAEFVGQRCGLTPQARQKQVATRTLALMAAFGFGGSMSGWAIRLGISPARASRMLAQVRKIFPTIAVLAQRESAEIRARKAAAAKARHAGGK